MLDLPIKPPSVTLSKKLPLGETVPLQYKATPSSLESQKRLAIKPL